MARPIELRNIALYNKGHKCRNYRKVDFDSEVFKKDSGRTQRLGHGLWMMTLADQGQRKTVPSLPMLYAVVERLHDEEHPGFRGFASELSCGIGYHTSTMVDYQNQRIVHGYGSSDTLELKTTIPPRDSAKLTDLISDPQWAEFLNELLLPKSLEKAVEILTKVGEHDLYCVVDDQKSANPLLGGPKKFVQFDPYLGKGDERSVIYCNFGSRFGGAIRPMKTRKSKYASGLSIFAKVLDRF
jgi:hypothetical protein